MPVLIDDDTASYGREVLEGVRCALPEHWPTVASQPAHAVQSVLAIAYVALLHCATQHAPIQSFLFDDLSEEVWHRYRQMSTSNLSEQVVRPLETAFSEVCATNAIDVRCIPFEPQGIDVDSLIENLVLEHIHRESLPLLTLIWRECGCSFYEPSFVRDAIAHLCEAMEQADDARLDGVDWEVIDVEMHTESCRTNTLWRAIAAAIQQRWPVVQLDDDIPPEWLISYAFADTRNNLLDTSERAFVEYYECQYSDDMVWSNAANVFAIANKAQRFLAQWSVLAEVVARDFERSSQWFAETVRTLMAAHTAKHQDGTLIALLAEDGDHDGVEDETLAAAEHRHAKTADCG